MQSEENLFEVPTHLKTDGHMKSRKLHNLHKRGCFMRQAPLHIWQNYILSYAPMCSKLCALRMDTSN